MQANFNMDEFHLQTASSKTRYRGPLLAHTRMTEPVRVLVVDPDFSRCASIAVLVHLVGQFQTRLAYSAAAAQTFAGEFEPQVVLINTDVSELGGYELASQLRSRAGQSRIRLIALTAEIAATDRRRALEAGFEQYLSLPIQQASLQRVLGPRSEIDPIQPGH